MRANLTDADAADANELASSGRVSDDINASTLAIGQVIPEDANALNGHAIAFSRQLLTIRHYHVCIRLGPPAEYHERCCDKQGYKKNYKTRNKQTTF